MLRRLPEARRTATLLATSRALQVAAVDDALDLFAVLMATKLIGAAERVSVQDRLRSLPQRVLLAELVAGGADSAVWDPAQALGRPGCRRPCRGPRYAQSRPGPWPPGSPTGRCCARSTAPACTIARSSLAPVSVPMFLTGRNRARDAQVTRPVRHASERLDKTARLLRRALTLAGANRLNGRESRQPLPDPVQKTTASL